MKSIYQLTGRYVDDCSTDGSKQYLEKLDAENIKVIFHAQNQGKGTARTSFLHSKGDIKIIKDADLKYDPEDYNRLLKPIIDGKADVVYGFRFISGDEYRVL